MNPRKTLNKIKLRRKKRTRAKIYGTAEKPRFSVFRSNQYAYVQLIDDQKGKTIISASIRELKKKNDDKINQAKEVGKLIAERAAAKGIKKAIFDRGRYKYHGIVKSIAEGAKEGGLQL